MIHKGICSLPLLAVVVLLVSGCGGGGLPARVLKLTPESLQNRALQIRNLCLGWTEATENGVTYRIHFSRWQRINSSTRSWDDIPGTRRVRRMCGYTPTASGNYRLVMELSINGKRGRYASANVLIAICDRGESRFFQL